MPLHRHLGVAGRWAAAALLTLAFWTLGLGLCVLLAVQAYVATSDQLEVPDFVVRALEQRLAVGGMHATFGRTRFDPSGRVLIEDVRVTLPGSEEPLVSAAAAYARLDLWALLQGRFEPLELRLTGASLRVPAMFSPSGQADEIVRDLSADLFPRGAELEVAGLSFRLGELAVSAHGTLHLGSLQSGQPTRMPLAELLAEKYGAVTRQFSGAVTLLGVLDRPILDLALEPSELHGAIVRATLVAAGLHLPDPVGLQAGGLRVTGEFPLLNTTEPVEIEARAVTASLARFGLEARALKARLRVDRPAGRVPGLPDLRFADLSAAEAVAAGVAIRTPSASLVASPWPKVRLELHGRPLDAPLTVQADLDFSRQTAAVRVDGELAPALLDVIGARVHRDLRRFVSPASPVAFAGDADFGPGWTRFRRAGGRFAAENLDTWQHLRIDEVRGRLEYDGRHLAATDLYTRFGGNFARGSYEMDVPTLRYRFLLSGRLRPLDIQPWFPNQPWWGNLFRNFQFPVAPPAADMEWRGRWPTDHETVIFLSVDAPGIALNGVPYDRVYGRLFVRPHFDDALEFLVTQGTGAATGTFTRWYDQKAGIMRRLELDLSSTLDLSPIARVWPKEKSPPEVLTAFAFDQPPTVRLTGHFDTPGEPGDVHKVLHVEARTDHPFRFHGFPLDRLAFTAEVRDSDFVLEPLALGFAGGAVTGRVQVRGAGQTDGRIAVGAQLADASLPRAIELVQNYSPKGPPRKPAVAGEFLRNMAGVRLDLAVSAEGAYADPLSYRGQGKALVQGPELTKVRLLGLLTPLLPFLELRFTRAQADFAIDGGAINFPDVTVTGANSRIDAHGAYAVASHGLDFNATVFPLRENRSLLGVAFSGALAPLSVLSQVQLHGTLDDPKWSLVASPFNILRNLVTPGRREAAPAASLPASPLAHPAPVDAGPPAP